MKKNVFIILLIGAVIGGIFAYYQFSKTHEKMATQASIAKLSSEDLFNEFNSNESLANEKYVGKVIEVMGKIYSIEEGNKEDINILFMNDGEMFGVSCNLKKNELDQLPEVGQTINIKGECTGMLSDVILIRCIILNS